MTSNRKRAAMRAKPARRTASEPPTSPKAKLPKVEKPQEPPPPLSNAKLLTLGAASIVTALIGVFVFRDVLIYLWNIWGSEPDYSHGYLVVPFAIFFLYMMRSNFPGFRPFAWSGLVLILLSVVVRFVGDVAYIEPLAGWAMVMWIAGAVWCLCGWPAFRWAAPVLIFLCFMLPWPYRMERALSVPLQRSATVASTWTLQTFGEPAISKGNNIRIGDNDFAVKDACSGLRIFESILAIAYVYLIFVRRSWWERAFLVASVLPVALLANITRVVVTCLLHTHFSETLSEQFSHDIAGYVMIPYAAALFAFVLWYIQALLPELEQLDVRSSVRHG
jgi:exosortase